MADPRDAEMLPQIRRHHRIIFVESDDRIDALTAGEISHAVRDVTLSGQIRHSMELVYARKRPTFISEFLFRDEYHVGSGGLACLKKLSTFEVAGKTDNDGLTAFGHEMVMDRSEVHVLRCSSPGQGRTTPPTVSKRSVLTRMSL